jgi:hypothetical protein
MNVANASPIEGAVAGDFESECIDGQPIGRGIVFEGLQLPSQTVTLQTARRLRCGYMKNALGLEVRQAATPTLKQ